MFEALLSEKIPFYHFLRFNKEKIDKNIAFTIWQIGYVNSRLLIHYLVIHANYNELLLLFTESN